MNKREIAKARRIVESISHRTELATYTRSSRGRQYVSTCLTVYFNDGSQRLFYTLDSLQEYLARSVWVVLVRGDDNDWIEHSRWVGYESAIDQSDYVRGRVVRADSRDYVL